MKHFELLAHYNKNANDLMNKIITSLTEEQWNKQFGGFFTSIHENCAHIYMWDYNWFKRYTALPKFNGFADGFFSRPSYTEMTFSNITEYINKRIELDNIIIDFINNVTEADLETTLHYINSKRIETEKRMDGLLIHIFNHQTHHRGMISIYLEMLGINNDYSNVLPYVAKS